MTQASESSNALSYRVETWGCQMNVLDGERLSGQLEGRGLRRADASEECDVLILNTCAVREKAADKVYSALGVLTRKKQENPNLVVGVTGCLAQVQGDEILERAPFVDFVLGPGSVEEVGKIVERVARERVRIAALELPQESPVYQFRQITRGSAFQAYVTVIEGCSQFCTFCIVPFTRGRERSRRAGEILEELVSLSERGYTEITLLGQTVNAYRDPEEGFGFGRLLRKVAAVPNLKRVRFLTSHPSFVDAEMIEALADKGIIAPYLHLPAQSGSNRILDRMKRRYDRDQYIGILERVRQAVPEIALSSDFIVGFPGETESDFEQTLSLVREARFASLFAFRYSPRPGTASARWGSSSAIPEALANERLARLLELQETLQIEGNRALEGRRFEVLIEGTDRKGQSRGRTPCNRIVHIQGGGRESVPGSYVRVRIVRGLPNSLVAELAA